MIKIEGGIAHMMSPWESEQFYRNPHVAVVGGGIVGLFAALFYKRTYPDHHVLVLEKGPFPSGASVKNAGFACFGSPSELLADIDNEGPDAALERVEMRWKGLLALRKELGDANIGFDPCGGHEVYHGDDTPYTRVAERFEELNGLLRPLFSKPVFRWNVQGPELFGLAKGSRIATTELEGAIDTGAMMRTLLSKVQTEGILFRTNSTVVSIEEAPDNALITLADGTSICAGQVLIATNGYTRDLLPDIDVLPARGQVLLTEPIQGLRLKGTFHFDEGYYYFRELNGSVLLGGGRNLDVKGETTMDEAITDQIQQALEQFLSEVILPGQKVQIAQRWSGIMGVGAKSKTPLIERLSERTTVAVRLGGMGVAIGIEVARRAALLVGS